MASNRRPLFRGTAPALVTPFDGNGDFDENAYRRLIDWQIEGGVEALVALGTTGENATVSVEERARIVQVAVEQVAGRIPVIIGTGNNSTSESIDHSRNAVAAGADGLLVVGPYYNKPPQRGFVEHVKAIANAAPDTQIILYNVPSRTSFNVLAETTLRIAEEVETVSAVKEASGDIAQISDILKHRPEGFAVYAGDDEIALPLICLGADGVISVLCNVLPGPFGQLVRSALQGDFARAKALHFELIPAMRACFFETNPIPVKTILGEMGLLHTKFRLPLVEMADGPKQQLMEAFARVRQPEG
jgi:4-hydroxy-tetrahydrodipicolinate synthase